MGKDERLVDSTIIWRYMSLESFLSLVSDKTLSFCRYDKLKSIDPYECSNSKYELEQINFASKCLSEIGNLQNHSILKDNKYLQNSILDCMANLDRRYFISCWHINNYESVAMWDSFTNSKTGVAIKTTLGNLKNSIQDDKYNLLFEPVRYVDLSVSTDKIDKVIRKSKYFEHEKELRVYFEYIDKYIDEEEEMNINGQKLYRTMSKITNLERIPIKVNLNELINEVVVSPNAEEWFINLISKVLKDYKISNEAKCSDIKKNNIMISDEYELIDMRNELHSFIENSSFGNEAKHADYRMTYDSKTGKIKAVYPTNFEYKEIPEPYIVTSWDVWMKWCNNNDSVMVDPKSKEILIK